MQPLRPEKIEKEFVQVAIDLKDVIVLDGVDLLHDQQRYRIRSHDLYGPLTSPPFDKWAQSAISTSD